MYYRLYSIAKKSIFLWFVLAQIVIAAPVPQLIKDVNTNPLVYKGSDVRIEVNGDLYYLSYGNAALVELRRHDPSSPTGSVLIGKIRFDDEYEDYPRNFIEMDGVLYFNAFESTWPYNYVLWKYDPSTSTGLVQVGDMGFYIDEPMAKVGGVLYFGGSGSIDGEPFDERKGRELWKYDPRSSTGPILVADINIGTDGSAPKDLTEIEGVLYFSADDGIRGREFWKYDLSSSNGPVLVADFYAGGRGSSPQNFIEVEGILYFTAYEPVNGRELWQYDPSTSPIPVFTGDINVGSGGIDLRELTEVEGVLYFTADDGVTGQELWQYDPSSTTGPVLVADLNAGPDKSRPELLIGIEGVLYFTADDGVTGRELWKYDPSSTTGPVLVADLRAGADGSSPGVITEAEGVLYFNANDGVTGRDRWKYDPSSTTGPVLAGDPYVGPVRISTSATYSSDISNLVSSNGIAYFVADSKFDGDDGWYADTTALWRFDPNASSESASLRILSGGSSSSPSHITEVGGVIYFSAYGDVEYLPGYGVNGKDRELWKYDPSTSTSAVLVADINEGGFDGDVDYSSNPHSLTGIGGSLYFKATDGGEVGSQWWQYDPNASTGPVPLLDVYGGSVSKLGYPVEVGGVLYFSAIGKTADEEETGQELWQYDPGSSAGPVLVGDIHIGTGDSYPLGLTEIGGVLYFSAIGKTADGEETGRELWQYDPNSSAGPILVGDINVGIGGSSPKDLTGFRDVLYFSAIGKTAVGVETGRELWQYDPGSSAGPVLVGDIHIGTGDGYPSGLTEVGGVLYFSAIGKTADGEETGRELWQYDPSSSTGPVLVIDIYEGSKSSSPRHLIEIGGNLYFSADDGLRGRELWGVINQSPVAVNDSYSLDANTTYTVESPGVLSNDNSADVNIVSTILDATVSHGTLVLNSNGSFSYTPELGFSGVDSFLYHNSDGTDTSESATVTLTVNSLSTNHPPVANAGADQLMIEATGIDTDVTLDGSGTTDADSGDSITYLWSWTINSVAYSASGISPVISLPLGSHLITLTASDQNGSTSDDTVTVSIVDTTAPTLGTVQDITLDATSLNGAAVVFTQPEVNDAVDPNPTVSCTANSGDTFAIGQTVVICTATDAEGNRRSTSFTVTIIDDDISPPKSLQITIETGSDDAEEESTGNVSLFSSDLELIRDGSKQQLVGLRFPLQIPAGATITSASIQLTADEISIEPTDLSISAEATAHALTFQDLYYDLSNRALTAANVAWIPEAWTLKGEAGPIQQTPDLSTIVQEIVDQSGWKQGNAIAFIISGNGMREAESYDGTAAPSLKVTYTTEPGVPGAPDAVDDDSPMAVAYTTDVDQQLIVANGADDIVERNDNIGFPAAEVSLYDETSAESGLVNVNPDGSFSYTPAAGFEGMDSFSYTLENTEGSDSAIVYIKVRQVTRITIPVIMGSDDAEEDESNGQIRLSSSDLELTRDDDIAITQRIGVRFQGLGIPAGATIIEAYIQYTADEKDSEPTSLTVSGEASVSAMTFSTTRFDISERMLTTAQVPWQPEAWNTQEQSSRTRTPDLSTIVQEIVDQDAWSEGNAIAFITKGNGKRVAESFNGTAAPVLHLSYSIEPDTEITYAIDDTGPGGGIVFHISNDGLNGLEAAPANQGLAMWGCYASQITGENGTTVGSGAQNTANILATCNEAGIAAEIADQYEVNNVTDWFLPSTDEALLMHDQRVLLGINANFWTSTENSAYSAFYIRLSQGDARTGNKNVLFDVWPIRAF